MNNYIVLTRNDRCKFTYANKEAAREVFADLLGQDYAGIYDITGATGGQLMICGTTPEARAEKPKWMTQYDGWLVLRDLADGRVVALFFDKNVFDLMLNVKGDKRATLEWQEEAYKLATAKLVGKTNKLGQIIWSQKMLPNFLAAVDISE